MKIAVFIPGRLKSERLANKLILPIGKTCLWEIACEKLSRLPDEYDKVALCSDAELVDIAEKYGIRVILRDKRTTEIDGPNHVIFKDLKILKSDYYMFLNPCLVFLKEETVIGALKQFERQKRYDSATSVKPFKNWLYHKGELITKIDRKSWSTKTVRDYFQAAHCFHIFSHQLLFEERKMLDDRHALIEVPEDATIDVDTREDFEFVKWKWGHVHR